MKNKEKWFFVAGITTLMVICSIAGFYIGVNSTEYKNLYSDKFECDLILEQQLAAYHGCNVLKSIILENNTCLHNYSLFLFWNACCDWIENTYYVEFDDSGDICFCEYNHAEKAT